MKGHVSALGSLAGDDLTPDVNRDTWPPETSDATPFQKST